MDVRAKLRTLLRLFFLAAVLMSVAVLSAITTIRLTIHGRQETLPNLVGMPIEQAQRVAGALGLQLNVEDRLYSDKIPADAVVTQMPAVERGLTIGDVAGLYWPQGEPNQVVAQDPPPATTDLQSPAVNFLVSMGPQPPAYLCPDFRGKFVGVVQAELQQAGFQNIRIVSIQSPGASAGTILLQDPPAGSKVTPDTVFEFQVAQ